MANSTSFLLRMTEEQKEQIKEQCDALGITVSEFCRRKIFDPSPSDTMNLNEIRLSLIRMERRILEIENSCCHSKTIENSEWQELRDLLNQIKEKYEDLVNEVMKSNQIAFQKSVEEDLQSEPEQTDQQDKIRISDLVFHDPFFDD